MIKHKNTLKIFLKSDLVGACFICHRLWVRFLKLFKHSIQQDLSPDRIAHLYALCPSHKRLYCKNFYFLLTPTMRTVLKLFLCILTGKLKRVVFANSVDPDEVAHNEPPHLDLHCLPSSLWILNMITLGQNIFWKFANINFVACFFGPLKVKLHRFHHQNLPEIETLTGNNTLGQFKLTLSLNIWNEWITLR